MTDAAAGAARAELVGDLDESALIARFAPLLPRGSDTRVGPGDDAAVVTAADGAVVVTTDVLVADHHFRTAWSSPADVGFRAAMQNLADVAAMGARPTGIVVALVLPPSTEVDWVLGFAEGLAQACGPIGAGVVGGDLSAGAQLVAAVTAFGDLGGRAPVLRSTARAGDVVAHSGRLGWSAAGLAALTDGRGAAVPTAVQAFLRPVPPLSDGPAAAQAGATSLMDVSDGLLRDAGRIAAASQLRLDLDGDALIDTELAAFAALVEADALELALTGGEDHGLLATFPADVALPGGFRAIGHVHEPGAGAAVTVDGETPAVAGLGWDHFRG